jgi:hypothetical protein
MEVRGAPARAGCAAALHHMAPRVPRFAHAIRTRHTRHAPPIARSCGRLQGTQLILHAFLHFLHNFPNMSHHSHYTPSIVPHTPASTIAHSRTPTASACDPPIDSTRSHSSKQLQDNCNLSCSFPNTFQSPTTTSTTALGLHATANATRTSPTAQDRPTHAHTPAVPIPALHFTNHGIASHMLSHMPSRTPTRQRDHRACRVPASPKPTAARREPATRGDLAPHIGLGRANIRPSIDHPSTTHRPSTDHPPTTHRPSIDHPSTTHRPSSDHPSTIHQPSISHPSAIHSCNARHADANTHGA